MGHCYFSLVLFAAAAAATSTSTMATLYLPEGARRSDIKSRPRRLERSDTVFPGVEDEERVQPILKATESVAENIVSLSGKTIEEAFNDLKFSPQQSPFVKFNELELLVNYAHGTPVGFYYKPLKVLARTLVVHYGVSKLSKWIEIAKQSAKTKALADDLEAGLFMYWFSADANARMATVDVFKLLKLNFLFDQNRKRETSEQLFKNSGLDILIGYASKRHEVMKEFTDIADVARTERKYEQEGQQEVAVILLDHFTIKSLSTMMEEAMKSPTPSVSVKKIEEGLVDHWITNYRYKVQDVFRLLKLPMNKDLASHPLMSVVVTFARKKEKEFELIKLLNGIVAHKTVKLQDFLNQAKTVEYSKSWAEEVEKWLLDYMEQKAKKTGLFSRLKRYKGTSPPSVAAPNDPLLNTQTQPISPKEARISPPSFERESTFASAPPPDAKKQPNLSNDASKSSAWFKFKSRSASARSHATTPAPKQPALSSDVVLPSAASNSEHDRLSAHSQGYAKKQPMPSSEVFEPLTSPESKPNPSYSTPHALPSDTKKQPMPSNDVFEPLTSPESKPNPSYSPPHALPSDTEKQPILSSDDMKAPVDLRTEPSSLYSSLRHVPPSDTKEQPIVSSETLNSPVLSKQAALPPDTPKSKSRFTRFRRRLSAMWAKLWAILWPFG